MNQDILSQLRNELTAAAANLKQCQAAYRGFKAFRNNEPGLVFCANQLLQGAAMLRDHAKQLAAIAENLHDTYSTMPEQLALDDIGMNGRA